MRFVFSGSMPYFFLLRRIYVFFRVKTTTDSPTRSCFSSGNKEATLTIKIQDLSSILVTNFKIVREIPVSYSYVTNYMVAVILSVAYVFPMTAIEDQSRLKLLRGILLNDFISSLSLGLLNVNVLRPVFSYPDNEYLDLTFKNVCRLAGLTGSEG